ncbi:S-adenosyl-L-methionine-dependent methyltransferase [Aspergillus varians]
MTPEPVLMLMLANNIRDNASILHDFLSSNGHPSPSFHPGPVPDRNIIPPSSPPKVRNARSILISSLRTLLDLVLGPAALLEDINSNDVLCMQLIHQYRIAQCFGPEEIIPFDELSRRCGLNVLDLTRVLRLVMTRHIFSEPSCGFVAHTAATRLLLEDDRIRSFSSIICEERFPASAKTADALAKYGASHASSQSGFSLANGTECGLYEELKKQPDRQERWNLAMSAMAAQVDVDFITNNVPFESYAPGSLCVDVGGGNGTISCSLVERLPNFRFLVQDVAAPPPLPPASHSPDLNPPNGAAGLMAVDGDRVRWETHDFFSPQTVVGDIYYFRNIFHNWPDAQCVQILQQHIPVLSTTTRLIIDDFTLHEPLTASPFEERRRRSMDITMLIYFGAHERTVEQWRTILAKADPRLRLAKVTRDAEQPNAILEVVFEK